MPIISLEAGWGKSAKQIKIRDDGNSRMAFCLGAFAALDRVENMLEPQRPSDLSDRLYAIREEIAEIAHKAADLISSKPYGSSAKANLAEANRVWLTLHMMFGWSVSQGYQPTNPAAILYEKDSAEPLTPYHYRPGTPKNIDELGEAWLNARSKQE